MRGQTKGHTTIIKRSAKKSHGSTHGGAWKVAFADFTLAMMALFMVLWIIGSVTDEERQEIVSALNGRAIFSGMSSSPITQSNSSGSKVAVIPTKAEYTGKARQTGEAQPSESDDEAIKTDLEMLKNFAGKGIQTKSLEEINERSKQELEALARIIMKITSAYGAQANLQIEIVPQGLRILVQDDQTREMFQRSSAVLTPFFRSLLLEFAAVLKEIDNKIIITGHTDATQFRGQGPYNNWDLSGERAMQAHRVLMEGGLESKKVLQVSGMADQMLLDPKDPLSSANRRIEIMVLTQTASETLYQFFGQHGENVIKPLADKVSQTVPPGARQ